jgi:hypothetical protein
MNNHKTEQLWILMPTKYQNQPLIVMELCATFPCDMSYYPLISYNMRNILPIEMENVHQNRFIYLE